MNLFIVPVHETFRGKGANVKGNLERLPLEIERKKGTLQ